MIKAIITDFDGTLIDTFEANLMAYQKAFNELGLTLTTEKYLECFGLRYDDFMKKINICDKDISNKIRELKKEYYPIFFSNLTPNYTLIELIKTFHTMGGKTAIASTARKENLMNAIRFLNIENHFDIIYSGVDVNRGKPDPEIYIKTINALGVKPEETLIFEDSNTGIKAAIASGAKHIRVTEEWFR